MDIVEAVRPRCGASTALPAAELHAKLAQSERDWQHFWCDWDKLPEPAPK